MKVVVGLGNPGSQYDRTRHNVGFRVVDRLAALNGWTWGPERFGARWLRADLEGRGLALMEPLTYMNVSGRAVGEAARFLKLPPASFLVVCDDFNIPLGTIRCRPGGSSGGQKGLQSILDELGTEEVPRLRVGIGPLPEGQAAEPFVLSPFGKAEEGAVGAAVDSAADRARQWVLQEA